VRTVESGRQHADHLVLAACGADAAAEYVVVTAEVRLPCRVTQHDDVGARRVILRQQRPAEHRTDAEQREVLRVHARDAQPDRVRSAVHRLRHIVHRRGHAHIRCGLADRGHFRVGERGDRQLLARLREHRPVQPPHFVRPLDVRRRAQQQPVDDAEDRRVRAEPERQRQDDRGGQARRTTHATQRGRHRARERTPRFDHATSQRATTRGTLQLRTVARFVAEPARDFRARGRLRPAPRHQQLDAPLEVRLELRTHLRRRVVPPHESTGRDANTRATASA
jgi:hypothetical protein